jgi:hypothetical protein
MLKTRPALYEVVGRQNNHLWLEVLDGGDRGTRVSVPVHDSDYDEKTQSQVLELSVGDVHKITLESESDGRPNWRIAEIEDSNAD